MSLKSIFTEIFSEPEPVWSDDALAKIAKDRAEAQKLIGIDLWDMPRTKARLAVVNHAPGRDEFKAWRDDPTTEFVMAALLRNADEHKELWLAESWNTGEADQERLIALRERADALRGIAEASYEGLCETLGLEPDKE